MRRERESREEVRVGKGVREEKERVDKERVEKECK